MMRERLCLRLWAWVAVLGTAVPLAALADGAAGYTLGVAMPSPVNMTSNLSQNHWLKENDAFFDGNFFYSTDGQPRITTDEATGDPKYRLSLSHVGPAYYSAPFSYMIGEEIKLPVSSDAIDWAATYERYLKSLAGTNECTGGFVFILDGVNSKVIAVGKGGEPVTLEWVLKSAVTTNAVYNIAPYGSGRPRRIYWTDYPYNNQKVDLSGKFVKFFGKKSLVDPVRVTVTNDLSGQLVVQADKIVSGLYLDPSSMVLEARGEVEGQVLMVYYRDGNYKDVLCMQTLEVLRPDTRVISHTIGRPVKPDGRGYNLTGLKAVVQAGVGDVNDGRGDYLYQHQGQHSYSAHNGDVYPIRPTEGQPWKAEVCWMEEDPMKVYWPFELDQYESDWPTDTTPYVRGDQNGDAGKAIVFPSAYTAQLMTYQEPNGHAKDVTADGTFTTDLNGTGCEEGYSLVKLIADDDIWFLPVRSVLRSNTNLFTLAEQEALVGQPLLLDAVSREAVAKGASFAATSETAPYVYAPGTPQTNYDANLYAETNTASVVYPVSDAGVLEVWWSAHVQDGTMPEPVAVPTLPAVYRPRWPGETEAPRIVLASQHGSANERLYGHFGAATFDAVNASLEMPSRTYFTDGIGTFAFWTRLRSLEGLAATNGASAILCLFGEGDRSVGLRLNAEKQLELMEGDTTIAKGDFPAALTTDWRHLALVFTNRTATLYADGQPFLSGVLAEGEFLSGNVQPVFGHMTRKSTTIVTPAPFVPAASAVECATWADFCAKLAEGKSVRLTASVASVGEDDASTVDLPEGANVTLDLNGCDIAGAAGICLFTVTNGATLVVGDSSASANGRILLNGGTCGCLANGGTFDLRGGQISGGTATSGGCFSLAAGGVLVMNGGTIRDCAAQEDGGAVYGKAGTVTMNGGTIESCVSKGLGGAVCLLDEGAVLTMNGGSIKNCTGRWGGAVYCKDTQFAMTGGVIEDCTATDYGGGVRCKGHGSFTVGGGIIRNNKSEHGGGVFSDCAFFTINSGGIYGNTASEDYPCLGLNGGLGTLAGGVMDVEPTVENLCRGINPRLTEPAYTYDAEQGLYYLGVGTAVGRQVAEVVAFDHALTADEIGAEMHKVRDGHDIGLSGYWSFRPGEDLVSTCQSRKDITRTFLDRSMEDATSADAWSTALNTTLSLPGAPLKSGCVIVPDNGSTPTVYRQNDSAKPGYNPNEEHAFVLAGGGGYVTWALRCDLGLDGAVQGVFVEYVKDGMNCLQFYNVMATDETDPVLGDTCTAGAALPGPQPLTLMSDPWLAEDYWTTDRTGGAEGVYRDRKGQLWCRRGGANFDIHLYYRNQDGFDWPTMATPPAVGASVPWLSLLDRPNADRKKPNDQLPHAWTWTTIWPENIPEMKIGQTLTVASDGLPEVWNARSVAVVYPAPEEGTNVVMLSDPTVMQCQKLSSKEFEALGLKAEPNGGLTLRQGKYRFTGASPFISERLYYDKTTEKLCFIGEREVKKAGATVLFPNVLSATERRDVDALVSSNLAVKVRDSWVKAVASLATEAVLPNVTAFVPWKDATGVRRSEVKTTYKAVDHYALTALGGYTLDNQANPLGSTNYVVLIENDAAKETMAFEEGSTTNRQSCSVSDGDPVNMHIIKIVPEYYVGRAFTREDANNLLSQHLTILYSDPFGGKPDDYRLEWWQQLPSKTGAALSVGTDESQLLANGWKRRGEAEIGLTRFVVGRQGDTLDNMVNKYWTCRYQAVEGSPARAVMGDRWSVPCDPPALAEGWLQRCLNNVTPFTQRMTDLYNNKAETPVTMLQEAGGPYQGDVALNQDNLTSVGLIELYETLLNKGESMSLLLGETSDGACQQLLLAVERLGDLYKVLGDEAYSDAKNPTISFGMTADTKTKVEFDSEASSLFCFDNQVKTLLDEELCLLRGRTGTSMPTCRLAPYYNRLVWNFTRGITAGEVAYAVNYAVNGTDNDKARLSEEEAAALYPQGHGDAYGHYLSALKGWYRLLRNPNFNWDLAKQGEMNVADAAINVDYYEEAKFAEAAADLAKTAADVVDLTARAAWRDSGDGVTSPGYLDNNPTNGFGYGEWASRGGYGALANWVVANSLLPMDQTLDSSSIGSGSTSETSKYTDQGLTRIDRGNTPELEEICDAAASIVRAVDRIDCGLNPLGLSDNAIPFDIAPKGVADGSNTHFEQVRDRAATALCNARKVLERAQTQSNRMRIIQSSGEDLAAQFAVDEEEYDEELLSYYGSPYSDDIGPGKTYEQGYEGADLYHYMWMDFSAVGITGESINDFEWEALNLAVREIITQGDIQSVIDYVDDKTPTKAAKPGDSGYLNRTSYASKLGVVRKPDSITGYRNRPGKIQEALMSFLRQYYETDCAKNDVEKIWEVWEEKKSHLQTQVGLDSVFFAADEAMLVAKGVTTSEIAGLQMVLAHTELSEAISALITDKGVKATPSVVGAGMAVVSSPRSVAEAVAAVSALKQISDQTVSGTLKSTVIAIEAAMKEWEIVVKGLENAYKYEETLWKRYEDAMTAAKEVASAYSKYADELTALNVEIDNARSVMAEAEAILGRREAARKRQVNALSKLRYNEMLFRQIRDKTLSKYSAAFDLAQKYVFMAAQVYDYETGLKRKEDGSRDDFKAKIVATRALGAFDSDDQPMVADDGDLGLAGYLAQMNANWLVLKPRLGINNPQQYTTWFSLRKELFRIYGTQAGDANWKAELKKYWVEDIQRHPVYLRHCQKFQSQFGLKDKEPGFVIPFSTTIDFAKNLFGNDLAGGDHAYDSTWYSTRIASAGVWFDGYNELTADAVTTAQGQLAANPTVYLIPTGYDCLRAPGQEDGWYWKFSVVDQVIPAPYAIGSYELDSETWYPSMKDADWEGTDPTVKIRKHPMFRAYYGSEGAQPSDDRLDATRLIGRSVWNTEWYLIIPAGAMNADRDKAMEAFLNGTDANRDGKLDVKPVTDIKIGFRTYSQSGS